jgi:nucleotide-binding universal stress UspA family protein
MGTHGGLPTLANPSYAAARSDAREEFRGNLIVATDGRPPSDKALLAAHALAGAATFGVVSVLPEAASKDRSSGWSHVPETSRAHVAMVEAQVRRVLGDAAEVWIEVRRGYPPAVLSAFAESHAASLLVIGIGRPDVLDRLLGDESTLRLARMTQTPLYAVAPNRRTPPERVVVATDFSTTSARAARLAIALAAPTAEILLAHVSTPAGKVAPEGSLRRHAEVLQDGFCGRVVPIDLRGDAASELLGLAKSRDAAAIAIGAHGHGDVLRCTLGPVATRVVRCAPCSVILAPA